MTGSKIRVAVLGCGAQGRNHLGGYAKLPDVEIAAVCDIDATRRVQVAADYGATAQFSDYRDLLAAGDYDLVSVCTMPVSHREMVEASFARGANVICEKPFAMNLAETVAMAEAARAADRFLTLGFNMRFTPAARFLKQFVVDGHLGKPISGSVWTTATDIPWWGKHYVKAISGGGVLASTVVHILDLSMWMLGNPRPVAVSASVARSFPIKRAVTAPSPEAAAEYDVEDVVSGHLRFDDGTWLTIGGAWSWDQPNYSYSFELAGEKSAIELAPLRIVEERGGLPVDVTREHYHDFDSRTGMDGWKESIETEVADVVAAIRDRRPPLVRVEEGLLVQAVIDATYRSAELNREVQIELPTGWSF
jgi:predicted dehydrogenase